MNDVLHDNGQQTAGNYEERKRQRDESRKTGRGTRYIRRLKIWGGVLLCLVIIGWAMVRLSDSVVVPVGDGSLSVPVSQDDHQSGLASASLTLVEYSDFQCPACAAYYPLVKKVLAEPELVNSVRFVYRSFPLTSIHKNALLAAQAAEAASRQNAFWQMHDILFEQQQSWSGLSNAGARSKFVEYAKSLNLSIDQFERDLESRDTADAVRRQAQSGESAGVNATPTFYINGVKMQQVTNYDGFKDQLLQALNAN